jgi:hypothetical protein
LSVIGTSISTDAEQRYISTGLLSPGSWNHVVAVLDFPNDQIRVSINGGAFEVANVNFLANAAVAGGTLGTTPDIVPARSPNSEYIGLLDEVAIWNTALSAENVDWLQHNSLNAVPEPGALLTAGIGSVVLLQFARRRDRSLLR